MRRIMEHIIHIRKHLAKQLLIQYAPLNKFKIRVLDQQLDILLLILRAVIRIEIIRAHNFSNVQQPLAQPPPDKPCAACDQIFP